MTTPFLAGLTPAETAALDRVARRRRWRRGAVLCVAGETTTWVTILLAGTVKLSAVTGDGREVIVSIRGAGAVMGAVAAGDGRPSPATVTTLEPAEALVIGIHDFLAFLRTSQRAMDLHVRALCEDIREASCRLVEHAGCSAAERVARCLVELAERFGKYEGDDGDVRIALALTQDELAAWAGTSREAASKALGMLRRRGWVRTARRNLLVRDVAALRDYTKRGHCY